MNIPGAGGLQSTRRASWLHILNSSLRRSISASNLVGLICAVFVLLLLIVPPIPWNFRLPLYLVVLVWTILRPRAALYLLPIAVPWGSLDYLPIGGLRLNSADLLVVFLAAGWLLSFTLPSNLAGSRERDISHVPPYLVLAILALLSTMFLSMMAASSTSDSLKEISKWLEFLVLLFLGTQYIRTRRQLWTIIVIICLAGISQAIYGYIQFALNLGPHAFVRDAGLRVYGTFDQPNPFAGYINIPLSIALALALLGRNWMTRILAGLTVILLGIAENLSQSRGGEIAIVVALAFIILVGMPHIRVLMRVLIIGLLGLVEAFLMGWIPQHVFDPALHILGLVQISFTQPSPQDYSTAERLAHWIAGLRMFFSHPVLGVGIGNYPDVYSQYFITIFRDPLGHAHNYYINIAAETGSIGLTAYLLFLLTMFIAGGHAFRIVNQKYRRAKAQTPARQTHIPAPLGTRNKLSLLVRPLSLVQYYRRQEQFEIFGTLTNDRALAIGLLAALISVCVHNLVDDLYVHSLTNLIALLLIALIRLERVTPVASE